MSKGLVDDAGKLAWRSEEQLKNDFGVELLLGTVSSMGWMCIDSSPLPRSSPPVTQ